MPQVSALRDQIASLEPGAFAVVMATGIVSLGMSDLGLRHLSTALLPAAVALMFVLSGALIWRLLRFGSRVLADARNSDKAFGYFAFAAAASVVGLVTGPRG